MTCKYPKESRMYYSCVLCDDKHMSKDTIITLPQTNCDISMLEIQLPQNVIPSASEANKMTNHVINDDTQLEDMAKEIKEAIANGKFSISKDGCLKPKIRNKLEELGYKVQTNTQYNELYYSISWE